MARLYVLAGSAALFLGSASPPPAAIRAEPPPIADPSPVARAIEAGAQPLPQPATAHIEEPPPATALPDPRPPEREYAPAAPPPAESASVAPPPSESGGVRVVVSIPQQKAYVFDDGRLLWTAPVSTGKKGHETPVGTFPILQKKVHHRSSKYDDAPMPYMQRLTWYGIALHAGQVPGYPASHGCIRLPRKLARQLYELTDFTTRVTITKRRPRSAREAFAAS